MHGLQQLVFLEKLGKTKNYDIMIIMKKVVFLGVAILILLGTFLSVTFIKQKDHLPFLCKDCNVILITLTNLRYDHLSQNGYFRPTSPSIDAFSRDSIVFDNAFAHSSWTLPEGISIYTSLYPYQHKVMDRYDGSVLSQNTTTLVDLLNGAGYKTAAFTGGFDYDPKFGLMNRFGEYQSCRDEEQTVTILAYGKISCSIKKALEWIKNNDNGKFFVHVQGFDAHCPFSQEGGYMYDKDYDGDVDYSKCLWTFGKTEPKIIDGKKYYSVDSPTTAGKASIVLGEDDVKHLVALYDESITLSDALIGLFLEEIKKMGLYENTVIIFTSEHGDMFGKQGRFMRGGPLGGTFYDDVLKIPLIIKIPGIERARLDGLVQHIDIMPTLLDILSFPKNRTLEGKSLIPLISQNEEVNQYVFAGSEFGLGESNLYVTKNTRVEAVRNKQWKLIREEVLGLTLQPPTFELYSIENDKEELYNLVDIKEGMLGDLKLLLSNWSERMRKK